MKKIIFTLVIIFSCFAGNSQTKITGFGKLKLGSPITMINEMGNKVEPISNNKDYIRKVYKNTTSNNIFELLADSTQKYQISDVSLDSRVRVFVIPKYSITETIEIKSVVLKFFKDMLIEIHCDGNEKLDEALTLKYGEPEKDLKKEEHQFTYTYTGNKVTKIDQTFTSKWQTNDPNISCTSTLMKWYSSKGEENFASFVLLSDKSHNDEIIKTETAIKERIKNRELLQKKQSLEGF